MAKTATTKVKSMTGSTITLYGRVTEDGKAVSVWSKHAVYGFYNLERFEGGVLTASSFRAFFGGGQV